MPSFVRTITHCRVCGTPLGQPYLHLGDQPLANALLVKPDDEELTAPLTVHLCTVCGLSQLSVVVDPDVLYAGYPFMSGTTAAWHDHCAKLADECGSSGLVVDLAANDGSQLKAFHERGWRCVGVDPAEMPKLVAVPYFRMLFDQVTADAIVQDFGKANLVTAQNVLGHVDDPVAFLTAAESMLAESGKIVVEVPNIRDLIQAEAFDTIYHEHLSYWSTSAMIRCARRAGLAVETVDRLKIHGGSRRYWLIRQNGHPEHPIFETAHDERPYLKFATDVERKLTAISRLLGQMHSEGKRLWAFGASAKGTVMLNALKAHGNTVLPTIILDDARGKQGRFSPGVHVPIKPATALRMLEQPDLLWILSWNWKDVLMARARSLGYNGKFLVTSPQVEVV